VDEAAFRDALVAGCVRMTELLARDGEGATIAANLRTLGKTAGLDDATLEACLNDQDQATALVEWYQANAEADGIEGTPTFFINGEKHANMGWDEMRGLIEAEIAEAGQ